MASRQGLEAPGGVLTFNTFTGSVAKFADRNLGPLPLSIQDWGPFTENKLGKYIPDCRKIKYAQHLLKSQFNLSQLTKAFTCIFTIKARICLLVDLREFFFRFRVAGGGGEKDINKKALKMTS